MFLSRVRAQKSAKQLTQIPTSPILLFRYLPAAVPRSDQRWHSMTPFYPHSNIDRVRLGIADEAGDVPSAASSETNANTYISRVESIDLADLSPTQLIARINELESRLKSTTAQLSALSNTPSNTTTTTGNLQASPQDLQKFSKPKKPSKPYDASRYTARHIALKFAYLGQRYNGLEHTNGGITPLRPTIEEALWKALRKTRLIPPDVPEGVDGTFDVLFGEAERKRRYWDKRNENRVRLEIDWTGLRYSKCGRTDKGVSAFGQVIGVTVRSNRPKVEAATSEDANKEDNSAEQVSHFDEVVDELPYISMLNSVLPPDIRVLAWCPNAAEDFDARFFCRERRYKYFFTNPAFCPTPGPLGLRHANGKQASVREGWLDIQAMRKAAKKLEGLHDFRNFCKIDASKQMSSCERRITFADIEEMPAGMGLNSFVTDPSLSQYGESTKEVNGIAGSSVKSDGQDSMPCGPKVYAFAVHGTAFLWHQVRCMVAALFLVGQGLEQPEIIDELLNIAESPARPHYDMASDAPLVLWDCVFPGDDTGDEGGLKWVHAGDHASVPALSKKGDNQYDGKFGIGGLVSDLWIEWREVKMRETLTAGLLSLALHQGDGTSLQRGGFRGGWDAKFRSQRIFDGANSSRNVGDYTSVMQKQRMDTLEVQNAKYLSGKQARRDVKKVQTSDE